MPYSFTTSSLLFRLFSFAHFITIVRPSVRPFQGSALLSTFGTNSYNANLASFYVFFYFYFFFCFASFRLFNYFVIVIIMYC